MSDQLSFNQYQDFTKTTAIYPGNGQRTAEARIYCTLKLSGESGEIAEKIGKIMRGGGTQALELASDDTRKELAKELGDVVWYVARLADELGFTFSEIITMNMAKLASRKDRGVIHGCGDNR